MIWVACNRTGGVWKSSIACNLTAIAASQGIATRMADLDPQAKTNSYTDHG